MRAGGVVGDHLSGSGPHYALYWAPARQEFPRLMPTFSKRRRVPVASWSNRAGTRTAQRADLASPSALPCPPLCIERERSEGRHPDDEEHLGGQPRIGRGDRPGLMPPRSARPRTLPNRSGHPNLALLNHMISFLSFEGMLRPRSCCRRNQE